MPQHPIAPEMPKWDNGSATCNRFSATADTKKHLSKMNSDRAHMTKLHLQDACERTDGCKFSKADLQCNQKKSKSVSKPKKTASKKISKKTASKKKVVAAKKRARSASPKKPSNTLLALRKRIAIYGTNTLLKSELADYIKKSQASFDNRGIAYADPPMAVSKMTKPKLVTYANKLQLLFYENKPA